MAEHEEVDPEIARLVLPEGRTDLDPEEVAASQRRRLHLALAVVAARHGYDRATVDAIAAAGKLSKASLYQLLGSKENVLISAVREFERGARGAMLGAVAAVDQAREKMVAAACEALTSQIALEPKLARLAFVEARYLLPTEAGGGVAEALVDDILGIYWDTAGHNGSAGGPELEFDLDLSERARDATAGGIVDLLATELLVEWTRLRRGELNRVVDLAPDLAFFATTARFGPSIAAEALG